MKKRFLLIFLAIVTLFCLTAMFVACDNGNSAAKEDYSVTVLSPDENPLSGITVSWMNKTAVAGSAETDADGKATANLPAGTYSIQLSGFEEGLGYDSVSVSSAMRNVTLTLSVARVKYTVTVTDKTGAPAANVNVSWSDDASIAGSAKTDANGKAECELYYGEYSVTLSGLPDGNIYDGAKTVTGSNPSVTFALSNGTPANYSVTVRSEGMLLFKNQPVQAFSGSTRIASGFTDDDGVFTFSAVPGNYTVRAASIPEGYSAEQANLTADVLEGEIVLSSSVITSAPASNQTYVMGDIIHNYSFTTPYELNGKVWSGSVAEILQSKEMLIINNWGTNCSWCVTEMPAMQEMYEKYSDKIEIVAVSNYVPQDSDSVIINYYASNGYTFPMMRDTNGFRSKFRINSWPTTVIIDRYGAVARIEVGAVTSAEAWERLILKYIGDDYTQTFVPGEETSDSINNEVAKPDIELPDNHYEQVAATLNNTATFPAGTSITWRGETEYEYAWPFVLGTVEGVSPDKNVLYASNIGKANSMAIIYADVNVEAGKVLTFDYYSDTQSSDIFYLVWDGRIVREISGNSGGWQTCYLYSEIVSGRHTLSITYIKDSSGNADKDTVYMRDVRFTDVSDLTQSTDMLRSAAYGTPEAGGTTFPYYADVILEADGYYHVKLDSLQNYALAGNDENPLLLVNLLNVTAWSNYYSIAQLVMGKDENTGDYMFSCTFEVNGVTRDYRNDLIEYLSAASASDVPDFAPVDAFLHDMLVAFMKNVSGSGSHPNEWLEACYFYSHYGDGEPIGNPVLGLMDRTAIVVTEGTHTADLTRNMYPFPTTIFTFTPDESAVYKIESLIPEKDSLQNAAQIWLYDETGSADEPLVYCGDAHITIDGVNEHNFEVYYYMQAGHKYYMALALQMAGSGTYDFKITNAGQSVTELVPCSADIYDMVLDENGNMTGEIVLANAIEYVKDNDGYFHAKNKDGSMGDFIYLDVLHANTGALGTIPLKTLIDRYVTDPKDFSKLDYKMFDFRYCIMYSTETDSDGNEIINYTPKVDLTPLNKDGVDKYKDYTEILRGYIESAPTEGANKGLIKVNQELVDILSLYFELRANGIWDEQIEQALENEWLRFCWYYRTHNEDNP